jgi:3-dehydroquinate synthase
LGGGVVGDLAGFVAATILRGVPVIQIPTSLLAMVDASIGGKTAVNHKLGKNLVGAFHQPMAVLIDPQTLETLPERELKSGLAECIKHEIIHDNQGFIDLERHLDKALNRDYDYLTDLITHNIRIKSEIVQQDPYERKGIRMYLNFGHTLGHAIECAFGYKKSHGEAVALGMVAESHISRSMDLLSKEDDQRVNELISRAKLPIREQFLQPSDIMNRLAADKKIEAKRLRFVLPEGIGHVRIHDDVSDIAISQAIDFLRQ